ncbi:HRQ family protein 2 [Cordyceps javanica]|uniref:HRQ family protein 2 n=1 Tax=Cordyceps javanica TaxID=43265 RepID=A0A545VGX6_9HYPO|nr:HRQ family protein 2 [Cordyceps javanica]TQW12063.1 hypothetical protein IF2G_00794 [Cordyceps javanica]
MLKFVAACAAAAALLWLSYTLIRARRALSRQETASAEKSNDEKRDKITITPLEGLVWEKEKPKQLRPFKSTYHITMALQTDTPQDLITIDRDYLDRVTLRRALLASHPATVHGCTPHGAAAVRELYTYLLGSYLPQRYPGIFQLFTPDDDLDADAGAGAEPAPRLMLRNTATGATHPATPPSATDHDFFDPEAALRVLGETVEEDLFLLRETPLGHESTAFVCCFPAGFDPSEKLGRLLSEIHRPVPSYDKIAKSMERFFGRLEWAVQTHDQLFNCKANHKLVNEDSYTPDDEAVDISKTFVRIELQTLTRLPETRAILFSFKTYMYPVKQLKDEGGGPAFADAVEGLASGNAPGMRFYKGSVRWGKVVCEYLRS